MQLIKKYKLHHFLLWGIFFAAWYLFRAGDFPGIMSALQVTFIKVAVLVFLVYLTNYLLIPVYLYKKKYWLFGLFFVAAVLTCGVIKVYLMIQVLQPLYNIPISVFANYRERIYDDIIPLFLLVSTGATIKLVLDYTGSQKKLALISQQKAETELQYLKSQINPHFVFNTLNAIYFQIDKSNMDARETLIQFSDLLRYQLYDCNADRIPIEKELSYLQDYIQLQQKRKDGDYKISFDTAPEVKAFQIAPLLLIPFVENAFKHISHFTDKPNSICIKAGKTGNLFQFSVNNTKEPEQSPGIKQPGGIGLINVKRRLELLYSGRHSLNINDSDYMFSVELAITL